MTNDTELDALYIEMKNLLARVLRNHPDCKSGELVDHLIEEVEEVGADAIHPCVRYACLAVVDSYLSKWVGEP